MMEPNPPNRSRFWWVVGLLIVFAFTSSILWSIWNETLLPLIRENDLRGLRLNLIGIPLLLSGVALLVYGGIKFVRQTEIAMTDKTFHERADFVRSDPRSEARWEVWKLNMRMLSRLWWPALLLLGLALGLIIIGGLLINS